MAYPDPVRLDVNIEKHSKVLKLLCEKRYFDASYYLLQDKICYLQGTHKYSNEWDTIIERVLNLPYRKLAGKEVINYCKISEGFFKRVDKTSDWKSYFPESCFTLKDCMNFCQSKFEDAKIVLDETDIDGTLGRMVDYFTENPLFYPINVGMEKLEKLCDNIPDSECLMDIWKFTTPLQVHNFGKKKWPVPGKFEGINMPMMMMGFAGSTTGPHTEQVRCGSMLYLHSGAPKIWHFIDERDHKKYRELLKKEYSESCNNMLAAKSYWIDSRILERRGIRVIKYIRRAGTYICLRGHMIHQVVNLGFNVAFATNITEKQYFQKLSDEPNDACRCHTHPSWRMQLSKVKLLTQWIDHEPEDGVFKMDLIRSKNKKKDKHWNPPERLEQDIDSHSFTEESEADPFQDVREAVLKQIAMLDVHLSTSSSTSSEPSTTLTTTPPAVFAKKSLPLLHQDKRVKCSFCPCAFSSDQLNAHMKRVHGKHGFPCPMCKSTFTTNFNLKRHHFKIHELHREPIKVKVPGKLKCIKCGATFNKSFNLLRHQERQHRENL